MRSILLCIILVVGCSSPAYCQQLKSITNSIGMKLVLILPGTFTMGSPEEEFGRKPGETQHQVSISNWYYLGRYEVTQGQYEEVMGNNPSEFKGAKNPVETVSWEDAVSFCNKLSELPEEKAAGRAYRLPTDAEWEYACRATSTTAYCFGDSSESLGEYAWFDEARPRKRHGVGEKKANKWGLYDMHGNVGEWTQDWFDEGPFEEITDPTGPKEGSFRVIRGGSSMSPSVYCRSAYRERCEPSNSACIIGFRVAMGLPVKQPESASSK